MRKFWFVAFALAALGISAKKKKTGNLSIDFTNARPGNQVVIFTDLTDSTVTTFDKANGLQQSATVDKSHPFSIQWFFSGGTWETCHQSLFNDETTDVLELMNVANTTDNDTEMGVVSLGSNYSFDYSCR